MSNAQIDWEGLAKEISRRESISERRRRKEPVEVTFDPDAVKAVFEQAGLTASQRLVIGRLYPAGGQKVIFEHVAGSLKIGPLQLWDFFRSAVNKLLYALKEGAHCRRPARSSWS